MKSLWLLPLFALLLTSQADGKEKTYGDIHNAIYIGNYDGDTITFDIPTLHPLIGDDISVRIYGIDTPEIKGKCQRERELAKKAKARVKNILSRAKVITLKNVRRNKYFRILATVVADGTDITSVLVSEGLAVRYYGETKTRDWCTD